MKDQMIDLGEVAADFFSLAINEFIHEADREGIALMRGFFDEDGNSITTDEINEKISWALIQEGRLLTAGRAS